MFLRKVSGKISVRSRYGVRIVLDLPEDIDKTGYHSICTIGLYEAATTEVLWRICRTGDSFVDIGANIGWYALHFARFVPDGLCYAFEPTQKVFHKLRRNVSSNSMGNRVSIYPMAVGAKSGHHVLYTFGNLPHLCSALTSFGRTDTSSWEVKVVTLDELLESGILLQADIIKVDVEGSEMSVLDGASKLLSNLPPIWILEMNDMTSRAFNYRPVDLLYRLQEYADYEFVRIPIPWLLPPTRKYAQSMFSPEDYEDGDNVICYVREIHWERLKGLQRLLKDNGS